MRHYLLATRFACEFIRNGGLGKVHRVDLPNYPGPLRDPTFPAEPIPAGLDWELFCGPTELRPHNRKLWVKDEFKVGNLLWRGWDLWRSYSGYRTVTICLLANLARELNRPLKWNPATERFIDDDQANALLKRPRRKGFELTVPT